MPRRYNLRTSARDVAWIEDESLKTKEEVESEEEDEDYEEPSESEEESEEEEEEEEEPAGKPQSITIPIPAHGVIKIEIDNRPVHTYDDEDDALREHKAGRCRRSWEREEHKRGQRREDEGRREVEVTSVGHQFPRVDPDE